jgi:aspartate kinase
MPTGVVRFGGNSFGNKNHLKGLVDELKQNTQKTVFVVSAIPKIQTILHQGLRALVAHSSNYRSIITEIQEETQRFGVGPEVDRVQTEIARLESLLNGIELTGDYSEALRDAVTSFAEKISVQVLNAFLNSNAIETSVFYPEDLELFVTEEYGNATALIQENDHLQHFPFQRINLVPGSYGISRNRKVVRLGNRASDYTASALALILGAESLELWEPGSSFRTADPLLVPGSEIIARLTYEEASELSYFTRSSLHPRLVEPLTKVRIPVHIFRLTPSGKVLETIIGPESVIPRNVVKSVVSDDEITILKLNGPGVGYKPGILAKVTGSFHQAGINIRSVITSQVSINIILDKADTEKARQICSGIELRSVSELVVQDDVSLIAVVGHGMQSHHGVSARLFKAVADQKINVLLSGSGASDLVSYLVIEQKEKEKAISEIHKLFMYENVSV